MTIKSILVPYMNQQSIHSVDVALMLAKEFSAHVEILYARPDQQTLAPFILPEPGFMGEILSELSSEKSRHMETALSQCSDAAARAGIEIFETVELINAPSACLKSMEGLLEKKLPLRSRISDLIVLSLERGDDSSFYVPILRAALFKSGTPVLLIEKSQTMLNAPKRVVVAWNGSFESSRALRMSMPFLAGAKILVYNGVEGVAPEVTPSEAATYLRQHGFSVEERQEFLSETASAALRHAVEDFRADLLVMGAYSREDKLREAILGSLTADILRDFSIPVLMVN